MLCDSKSKFVELTLTYYIFVIFCMLCFFLFSPDISPKSFGLQLYRQFYLTYPHLAKQISKYLNRTFSIVQSPIAQLQLVDKEENTIGQSVTVQFKDDKNEYPFEGTKPNLLFNKLSFTHLAALLPLSCIFRPRNEWQNF